MPTTQSYNKRLEALKSERSSFIPLWRELSDYALAHRGRFLTSDRNKGFKRNTKQLNNKARLAVRTLSSGMMAGITSPARPWFKLGTGDPELAEHGPVKEWLHDVQTIIYRVFSQSNIYNVLHTTYGELGVFGTGPMGVFQDFDNVIWNKSYTAGSYYLAVNGKGDTDTFYREYEHTVAQVVKEFGKENCSRSVQELWDKGNTEAWVKLVHLIEPNDDRDMNSPLARDKAFRSVYYEHAQGIKGIDKFLRQSGFDTFPIMAPRWDVAGEDIYATDCPGMTALGDIKALQLGEKRKYQAVDRLTDPPMQGDSTLKNQVGQGGLRPGQTIWTPGGAGEGLKPIYGANWRPDLNAIQVITQEAEQRIDSAFYVDLFLMMAQSDRRQITAREVAEKQEEKLLMLGPVLERLHAELLDKLIDRTFSVLLQNGVLPPPPRELQGTELSVEYISILAQAQRMVAVTGLERLAGFAGDLSQIWPEARHKIDAQQAIDEYGDAMGVNPRVVRADDEAEALAQAEAQARQQAEQMAQAEQAAGMAKTASETDTAGDNALADTLRNAGLR